MGSSIKIDSISIDLAGATNKMDMVKCDHFSIRGFAAETREKDLRKCWPFSEKSVSLMDQESYSLPSLDVPKFRWWRCMSCIKDINTNEIKDCGQHSNSAAISEKKLDQTSSIIPNKSNFYSLNVIDNEKVKETNIGGSAVEERLNPRSTDASIVRRKRSKEKATKSSSMHNSKEKQKMVRQGVTTFGPSEIAGVVDDTPPKANKSISPSMSGLQRRKTRKVRLLSELLSKAKIKTSGATSSNNNNRKEESVSGRGRKRKLSLTENNYVSRELSTIGGTSENVTKSDDEYDDQEDRVSIKGKQKNRRFQVVDELLPQENEKDSVLGSPSTQRTEKKKNKKKKTVVDNGTSTLISFSNGNQAKPRNGPFLNAISQSTRDFSNEKRLGGLFGKGSLSSEGYFRKQVNDQVRSREAETNHLLGGFGSSNGWLRSGVDVFDFNGNRNINNNNNTNGSSFSNLNLRHTPPPFTQVADRSFALQKDVSSVDRKGKTVMVQEQHRALNDRKEKTVEEQNDDIPMEIVELMAKNQYERCLPDKEDDISNKETPHKSKNALLIDLNETYNGISLEDNIHNTSSRQPKPFDSNARKEPINFFPISQPSYLPPSPFGLFPPPTPPTQVNRFSGQWLGNAPTMSNQNQSPSSFRVLRPCNTCQSAPPHQFNNPIWSPSMRPPPQQVHHHHHRPPVSFNMDMSTKPTTTVPQSFSSNGNSWNLNFNAANEKQKLVSSSELSFSCKQASAVNNNGNKSMEANESSIPALHLLSLMDPRLKSNTSGPGRYFQQPNRVEPPNKQLPFDLYNKSFPVPPLGTSSSLSFQNAQASSWRKDTYVQQPVFASSSSNEQGKFQLLGASSSMKLPLKYHMTDKEKKQKKKAEGQLSNNNNASVWHVKKGSGVAVVCSVNRNPADFTIAEPGNVYMLTGENLKVRKRAATVKKKQPSLCKQDVMMKQSKKPVGPATENA